MDKPQVAGADEPYRADERCKACLRFVHSIHPALKQHVSSGAPIPPGYWDHALRKVCPPGSDCERAFVTPHGVEIALGLEDLHENADGDAGAGPGLERRPVDVRASRDAGDPAVTSPSRLFDLVCGPFLRRRPRRWLDPPTRRAGTSRSRGPAPRGPPPAWPSLEGRRHPRRRSAAAAAAAADARDL